MCAYSDWACSSRACGICRGSAACYGMGKSRERYQTRFQHDTTWFHLLMPNEVFILSVMSQLKDPTNVKWRDSSEHSAHQRNTEPRRVTGCFVSNFTEWWLQINEWLQSAQRVEAAHNSLQILFQSAIALASARQFPASGGVVLGFGGPRPGMRVPRCSKDVPKMFDRQMDGKIER